MISTNILQLFPEYSLTKDFSDTAIFFDKIKVSKISSFHDSTWILDGEELRCNSRSEINWDKPTVSGYSLNHYPSLLDSAKRIIFFLGTTIVTRKKKKTLTQISTYYYILNLIDWMLDNKIDNFKSIKSTSLNKYISFLRKTKKQNNIANYLYALHYLHIYKDYLQDSITDDLFKEISINDMVNYDSSKKIQTLPIPKEILEKICSTFFPIIDYLIDNPQIPEKIIQQQLIQPPIPFKNGNILEQQQSYIYTTINCICYFIIGLYTGMRVSEIISIKKNGWKIDENNVVIINSTVYKIVPDNYGKPARWGCGLNNDSNYALKCLKVLASLNTEDNDNLFFKYVHGKFRPFSISHINTDLNNLMNFCNVEWNITTHQLRRTFAHLIGVTDKTCLLALKEHFKHASIAMTDYYVGTNYELINMIDEEKKREIVEGLDSILSTEHLAGKLGEKLAKSNLKFRGDIVARKEYIQDLIHNSDLIIMPHEYGFCVYQPEQAKCRGETKNIGLNTCTKCNNFVVSKKHKVFWINRIEQYKDFKENIKKTLNQGLTIKELELEIEDATNIINKIG